MTSREDIIAISVMMMLWFVLYFLVNKFIEKPQYYQIQEDQEEKIGNEEILHKNPKLSFVLYKLKTITSLNAWIGCTTGIFYAIFYGFREDDWNNCFESTIIQLQISYYIYDLIINRIHKTDDLMHILHHVMAITAYSTTF